jgi:colanic acid/amylovoran biosynthesis glycosyltransferase
VARIAFFVKSFPKLSETFILHQATGLLDAGHEVDVFALDAPNEEISHPEVAVYDLRNRTTYLEAPLLRAGVRAGRNALRDLLRDLTYARSLAQHGRDGVSLEGVMGGSLGDGLDPDGYDVIHAHFGPIGNAFAFLAAESAARFVVSFYGYDASEFLDNHPARYRGLFNRADVVTVLSEEMRGRIINAGCPASKIRIVPLPIDLEKFQFQARAVPKDGPIRLLSVARLVEKKGIEYAIDAVAGIADEYDVEYIVAGEGPLRDDLEKHAEQRDISEIVDFRGWVDSDEVTRQMGRSHLLLLPSVTARSGDREGTPTVLLEGQAVGLPIVSTRHAGIPEIVADGEAGYLVPERDVEELRAALRRLLDRPDDWPDMGRSGRTYVQRKHAVDVVSNDLIETYGLDAD